MLESAAKILERSAAAEAIFDELRGFDAIMLGATVHRFKKMIFGSIPQIVAKQSLKTVVLVKRSEYIRWLKFYIDFLLHRRSQMYWRQFALVAG
ncbi:MAG: hypothetical protein KIS76_18825 [Pyrinomonadaceae bacterium]|nr:hypothetical protein [Pyrinomonadaceae bacterium]